MTEKIIDYSQPDEFFYVLSSDSSVNSILSQDLVQKEQLLKDWSRKFSQLGASENSTLVRLILANLSRDDKTWNQDRRDVMLEVLSNFDLSKINPYETFNSYKDAIATQNKGSDPYGSIDALLNAGIQLAPFLPANQRVKDEIRELWTKVASNFEYSEIEYIFGQLKILQADIKVPDQPLDPYVLPQLGARTKPTFDDSTEYLYDLYLNTITRDKQFRLELYKNTPQFREFCLAYGIGMENYWNLSDPTHAVQVLTDLQQHPYYTQLYSTLDRNMQHYTGISLSKLLPEEAGILADQILLAVQNSENDLKTSSGGDLDIINKLTSLALKALGETPKAQRYTLKSINEFLKENGIEEFGANLDEAMNLLQDTNIVEQIKTRYEQKQENKRILGRFLREAFKLDSLDPRFSFISRSEEDLYLGDLTGDCTSYHLNTGFNAWSVPVWLSNPGFNMFRMNNGGNLIAKAGMFLALADNKPVIVIDSFEVGKSIRDEDDAKVIIKEGFKSLSLWARRIGIEYIYINSFSNSTGATQYIEGFTISPNFIATSLTLMGGLSGISELRKNSGGVESEEKIYIQSEDLEEDDNSTEELDDDLPHIFERVISEAIGNIEEKNQLLEQAAREADWPKVFELVMNANYPLVTEKLGNKWEDYQSWVNDTTLADEKLKSENLVLSKHIFNSFAIGAFRYRVETFEDGPPYFLTSSDMGFDDNDNDIDDIEPENEDYESNILYQKEDVEEIANTTDLEVQALRADDFLALLAAMKRDEIDPSLLLRKIFGVSVESPQGISLVRNLPILNI